jgi:hypothetical protein
VHAARLLRGDARDRRPRSLTDGINDHTTEEVSHARTDQLAVDTLGGASMSASNTSPTVTEVLRFEDLPPGSRGTRRAIARWSDGTESEALTWYADEILVCEGDLIGRTRDQLRSLHFRRDCDWL